MNIDILSPSNRGIIAGEIVSQAYVKEMADRFCLASMSETKGQRPCSIREAFTALSAQIDIECPDSREKSLALTKLEEACMWTNKAMEKGGDEK